MYESVNLDALYTTCIVTSLPLYSPITLSVSSFGAPGIPGSTTWHMYRPESDSTVLFM